MTSPSKTLVVDASVAVKWHLKDEEYAAESAHLLRQYARGEVELIAPAQIGYEVGAAISVATIGQNPRLTREQGREAIEEFLALGIRTTSEPGLILDAFDLLHRYGIALYDALYLALSRGLRIPLVHADRRLQQRIGQLPDVVWIGDYR